MTATPLPEDPNISKIFYYFASHTTIENGRTMGRKIGVVQEILVKKLLMQNDRLRDSVVFEPKIEGRSGAGHKVEFVFFQPLGVVVLRPGQTAAVPGTRRLRLQLHDIDRDKRRARLTATIDDKNIRMTMEEGHPCGPAHRSFLTGHQLQLRLVDTTGGNARFAALELDTPRLSIESKRVGAQRFSGSDKLGSGIQTIEKAKQASLVAIDFDLKFNGTTLALTGRTSRRSYRSMVVLGNGVHWGNNDKAVLDTYVDYTYLAKDDAIIRYADYVKERAAAAGRKFFDFFMSYFNGMTKTPPDSFNVRPSDFEVIRPKNAPGILDAAAAQIEDYPVAIS